MSDIAPIGRLGTASFGQTSQAARPAASVATRGRAQDQVELSRAAQLLSQLTALPDIRQGLVDRVRAEIAAGTYETPEKLDAAAEGLLEDLA